MSAGPTMPLRGVIARWDALAIRWDLDDAERTSLLGGGVADGRVDDVATYGPASAERRMRLLVELEPILAAVHGDEDRTRTWLRRPNASLGGGTPIGTMASSPEWNRWLVDAVGTAA